MGSWLDLLRQQGGYFEEGHFVFKEGEHSSHYLCIDPFLANVGTMASLAASIIRPFALSGVTTVAGPAIGGIALVEHIGSYLAGGMFARVPVHAVWADKTADGNFAFTRWGFAEHVGAGKQVVVAEDVITTGGSASKVCRLVEEMGGNVLGVVAIFNRGGITAEMLGVPRLHCLEDVSLPKYLPDDCPLCRAKYPIVVNPALGHGHEYRDTHQDYPGGFIEIKYAA